MQMPIFDFKKKFQGGNRQLTLDTISASVPSFNPLINVTKGATARSFQLDMRLFSKIVITYLFNVSDSNNTTII